ncbi:Cytosol aminopeptidase [invertebrate metagenome]|uniref:leucyl aminopeptidase n=1 Tax=invertebrate metagenome TaxID=1711999 RepID=A0A2H9T6G9_9ZZZZ
MEYLIKSGTPEKQKTACLVLPVCKNKQLPAIKAIDDNTDGTIKALLKRGDLSFEPGQTLIIPVMPDICGDRLLMVAIGEKPQPITEKDITKILDAIISKLMAAHVRDATLALGDIALSGHDQDWLIQQLVDTFEYHAYRFDVCKGQKDNKKLTPSLKKITLLIDKSTTAEAKASVTRGKALAKGRSFARTLGNLPGNICSPTYLAEQARSLAKQHTKLTARVLGEKQMTDLGMNAFLSVSRGSAQEGKLIIMEYKNGKKGDKPVVFVGKGITFDSGGISLKPGAGMDEMKFDMCGAASVFGVMQTLVDMELPVHVIGMVAAAENMPGSQASRPGDIVTSMSGQTIEILNTDAEGRLVLCDALTYAERFKPAAVIDIATLTGACIIALGHHISGLMGNNHDLTQKLLRASDEAQDKAWQLPLGDDYQKQLDSNFADMANIGGRPGGTITAGCFLARFTEKYPWAHLDIAGTAWLSGKKKGATGRPVPMLVQYLINRLK